MTESAEVSRRDFVTVVVGAIGAVMGLCIGIPAVVYLVSPALKVKKGEDWVSCGPLENYPIGVPTLFSFTRTQVNGWEKTAISYGVYILRGEGEQVLALSNLCTHLSCRVRWQEDLLDYVCPCHDGHFNIEGAVVSGPPPRPLDPYQTKIEDGELFVFLKQE
jgi:menaquinol-cytochrome c reductase iron-sulfur subunit